MEYRNTITIEVCENGWVLTNRSGNKRVFTSLGDLFNYLFKIIDANPKPGDAVVIERKE